MERMLGIILGSDLWFVLWDGEVLAAGFFVGKSEYRDVHVTMICDGSDVVGTGYYEEKGAFHAA